MIEAKCSVYFALTDIVMTISKSGQSQALVPTGRQTDSCALARAKRSRENFLIDLDNKKSIESTRNVYPI